MTCLCILVGICLGSVVTLFIRNIQHILRINELEWMKINHSSRIEKLEKALEELKKETK